MRAPRGTFHAHANSAIVHLLNAGRPLLPPAASGTTRARHISSPPQRTIAHTTSALLASLIPALHARPIVESNRGDVFAALPPHLAASALAHNLVQLPRA